MTNFHGIEINAYNGVFRLDSESFPELKDATIVVTHEPEKIIVAVKAPAIVYERNENGSFTASPTQVGDYAVLEKTATLEEFCMAIKTVFEGCLKMKDMAREGNLPNN